MTLQEALAKLRHVSHEELEVGNGWDLGHGEAFELCWFWGNSSSIASGVDYGVELSVGAPDLNSYTIKLCSRLAYRLAMRIDRSESLVVFSPALHPSLAVPPHFFNDVWFMLPAGLITRKGWVLSYSQNLHHLTNQQGACYVFCALVLGLRQR